MLVSNKKLFGKFLLSLLILAVFVFAGCKNFLNGTGFLEELENTVAYLNGESFFVTVEADSKYGKITDSGKKQVKSSDSLSLSFEANSSEYVFLGWSCVRTDSGEDACSNVEFENILSPKTTVKFLKTGDITITPKCAERPYVKNFSPAYDQTGVGVAKNTSVIIEFAQKLETPDLSKIIVDSSGNVTSKFSPSITENVITLVSKELIDLKSNTQDVTVKIPCSYFYSTKDVTGNDVQIYLSPDYDGVNEVYDVHTYLINSTTSDKTEIYFSVDSEYGKLDFTGQKTLNIGDSFTVTFKKNKSVEFSNWVISAEGYTPEELQKLLSIQEEHEEDTNTYVLKGIVGESIKGITIQPLCNHIPIIIEGTPSFDKDGVSQDSQIAIVFSKPINLSDFYIEGQGLKNIEISESYNDIKSCFNRAFIRTENTTDDETVYKLILVPDETKHIINDFNTLKYAEVTVNVLAKTAGIKDATAEHVPFDSDYSWTYKINNQFSPKKPEIKELEVYKPDPKNWEHLILLNDKSVETWEDKDFSQNHLGFEVFFKCKAYDADSGISKLKVKLTGITDVYGTEIHVNNSQDFNILKAQEDGYYEITDEKYFSIEEDYPNGLYKLDFAVYDYANNESPLKTVYIIKDNDINCNTFKIWNEIPEAEKTFSNKLSEINNYLDSNYTLKNLETSVCKVYFNVKDIYCTYGTKQFYSVYDPNNVDSDSPLKLEVMVNSKKYDFKSIGEGNYEIELKKADINKTSDTLIEVHFTDEAGSYCPFEAYIPGCKPVYTWRYNSSKGLKLYYDGSRTHDIISSRTVLPFFATTDFSQNPEQQLCLNNYTGDSSYLSGSSSPAFYCSYMGQYVLYSGTYKEPSCLYGLPGPVCEISGTRTENPSTSIYAKISSVSRNSIQEIRNGARLDKYFKCKITFYNNSLPSNYKRFVAYKAANSVSSYESMFTNYTDVMITTEDTVFLQYPVNYYFMCGILNSNTNQIIWGAPQLLNLSGSTDKDLPEVDSMPLVNDSGTAFKVRIEDKDFKKNNGKVSVKYWYDLNTLGVPDIPSSEIEFLPNYHEVYITPTKVGSTEEVYLEVPTYDLEDGTYYIAVDVSDAAWNEYKAVSSPWCYLYSEKRETSIEYNSTDGVILKLKVKDNRPEAGDIFGDAENLQLQQGNFYYQSNIFVIDNTTYDWKYKTSKGVDDIEPSDVGTEKELKITKSDSIVTGNENKYLKFYTVFIDKDRWEFLHIRSAPQYLFIGEKGAAQKTVRDNGNNSYLLQSEKPYLVETFVSSVGYKTDVEEWTLRAECKSPLILQNGQYYVIDTDNIKNGYYYCLIIHWADGTTTQTEVRQKK